MSGSGSGYGDRDVMERRGEDVPEEGRKSAGGCGCGCEEYVAWDLGPEAWEMMRRRDQSVIDRHING